MSQIQHEAVQTPFDYDQIPVGYYDAVYHRNRGVQSKWHHMKFDRFRRRLRGHERHLDIGCGPGTFIGTLGNEHTSTGVDIAAEQIAFAQTRYGTAGKSFTSIDGDLGAFADGSFDVVTIIELVEHLVPEKSERLLQDAIRVLKPGGTLLISTPNYGGLWPVIEAVLNRWGQVSYEKQHITHYTRLRLIRLLQQSGFTQIAAECYMFLAPFTACLGWRFADGIARLEPKAITSRFGLLLFASARKPE